MINSIEFLEKQGFTCTRVKVDKEGVINPEDVRAAITDKTTLIAVHHVNHDIGTIAPIREIGKIASEKGIAFYVDAEASAGWLPIDVQAMGANLFPSRRIVFTGRRASACSTAIAKRGWSASFTAACRKADGARAPRTFPQSSAAEWRRKSRLREMPQRIAHTARLQKRLWDGLKSNIKFIKLNGPEPGPKRISTNLNISTEFIEGEGQLLLVRHERHCRRQRFKLREQVAEDFARARRHRPRSRTRAGQHHHLARQG